MRFYSALHKPFIQTWVIVLLLLSATIVPATISAYGGGGGKNIVRIHNYTNNRLRVKSNIQFNQYPGPKAALVNEAFALASCTDCETFAVALQISLISKTANQVTAQNSAAAINQYCTRCHTTAWALQYVIAVDNPKQVPREVSALLREMERELKGIRSTPNITIEEAEARINSVIQRFSELAESLNAQRDESTVQ